MGIVMGAAGVILSFAAMALINRYDVDLSTMSATLLDATTVWLRPSAADPDDQANRKSNDVLFTPDELSEYDGRRGLYLALLGQVFNVERGAKHYASGAAYHSFTGRDASRSFVTGDFSPEGLRDDVLDLRPDAMIGLEKWLQSYHDNYEYIGKLIGRYYTETGEPTEYSEQVKAIFANARWEKQQKDDEMVRFPPCNTEWTQEDGGRVWCTKFSGGVRRDWEGVPRQMFNADTSKPRCVCVQPNELGDPNLKPYPGCPNESSSCMVN